MTHCCISHSCSEEFCMLVFLKERAAGISVRTEQQISSWIFFSKKNQQNPVIYFIENPHPFISRSDLRIISVPNPLLNIAVWETGGGENRALGRGFSRLCCRDPPCQMENATTKAAGEIWELSSHPPGNTSALGDPLPSLLLKSSVGCDSRCFMRRLSQH